MDSAKAFEISNLLRSMGSDVPAEIVLKAEEHRHDLIEAGGRIERAQLAEVDGLFDQAIPNWYFDNLGIGQSPAVAANWGNARMAERVWVANRCQQMNSQQIAAMPLEFHGPDGAEPAWVSDPDPNLFPNGIGDAIHSLVDQMYGWGYALLYPTSTYPTGYPRTFTQIPSEKCTPRWENGRRVYELAAGGGFLDPDLVIQIDRNPGTRAHGTSALRAYGPLVTGLLTSEQQAMSVNAGGVPMFYLQAKRPVNREQAEKLQGHWMQRTAQRGGAPPVVPPDIEPQQLSINPKDLALLENQEFGTKAIMTAYGCFAPMLNMALQGGLTYQNPAALGEMWWRFELRNVATRVANALSARALPRGQWVSFRAEDTFAALTDQSADDDEQAAVDQPPVIAGASPQLTAITG